MPGGSAVVVGPDRQRAKKPGGAFTGRYPHCTTQLRRGRRAPPLQPEHRILDALCRRDKLLADRVEAQPLGQAVEQNLSAKTGLERG